METSPRRRRLAGHETPVVGQGTWMMEEHPREAVAALRRGLDLGLDHIDTAEMYGAGQVEELVGEAIAGRRDEVFLVSKVLPENGSRRGTVAACEGSLRRLGTDRLDLYLLHWPGPHPFEETLAGFEDLLAAGKIRAWGVSNFDLDALEEAYRLGGSGLTCNQVLYHLGERHIEKQVIPWCAERGVMVVAYSPLGQGSLPITDALVRVARRHQATEAQVALAFLTRDPNVLAIPKAVQPRHVDDNAGAASLTLTDRDVAELDAAYPTRVRRGLPTA